MEIAELLMALGVLFLAGLVADQVGRFTRLPRVTMLLLLGLGAGQAGLDLIPGDLIAWFEVLSIVALTMVAFLLGGTLTREILARRGRAILILSLVIALGTAGVVVAGLVLIGLDWQLALVLGAIATATDPAAMTDVIRQTGVKSAFTDTLKGIVAIDDVWGLILFSLVLAVVSQSSGLAEIMGGAAHDILGGVALGVALGVPAALLTGRLTPGEPQQAEAIGIVFLTAGLALWLEVSFLIAGMTAGAVVVNFAQHHERAFHEIEHVQWPFMILFFLLAGATLEVDALLGLGWAGVLYLGLRILARIVGGFAGGWLAGASAAERRWYGPALLPQAGVAVGIALVAGEALPDWTGTIMALTIASAVVFEVAGPSLTLLAIRRVTRQDG
ncbi:potassium/proton antiporter [Roseovarius sp. THAF9]|uniref:cation:proton antiporter n=1 Tax=Roseovarius sp. THAF9 TaxID=2587847 RepID=UPI0012683426|nr:cation:proton antiporter [Roseovarius sp. THAF9]QFT91318.1 potassium/proton antiporter [Roseovarius sp. THAF9]